MAVWGQGDPRWLVEHRDDGKNVNGWHWQEESRKEWSRKKLTELFSGLCQDKGECSVSVTTLKEMTGEASITVRKGNKRFPVYDLKVTLAWEGQMAAADGGDPSKVTGSIVFEEIISTLEPEEYVVTVSAEGAGAAQDKCRGLVESMRPQFLDALAAFIKDIHDS